MQATMLVEKQPPSFNMLVSAQKSCGFFSGGELEGAALRITMTHCDSATCFRNVNIMLAPTTTLTTTRSATTAAKMQYHYQA